MAETGLPGQEIHLPSYVAIPGQTDPLFVLVAISLVVGIFLVGVVYFKLHALPERMAHGANRGQYQIVAILALIALFTHNNLFWILALLLAAAPIPDFAGPIQSIARSLERIATAADGRSEVAATPPEAAAAETESRV